MRHQNKPTTLVSRLWRVVRARRWFLIGALWAISLALGFIGFRKHTLATGSDRTDLDTLYLALQLFILESGSAPGPKSWELEIARLLAPLTAGYTAIQALVDLFIEQFQFLRLRFIDQHVIICGLGRRGTLLAQAFCERGYRVVVVEQDGNNAAIKTCRQQGAVVLVGDATNVDVLEEAGISRARYLIAVCDDDGVNVEIAAQAWRLSLQRRTHPLNCLVHLSQPQLCELLLHRSFSSDNCPAFRLDFFNVFALGAQILLEKFPPRSLKPGQPPHIVIVGFGSLGQSLAIQAARSRYCTLSPPTDKLQITVIDREANRKVESLHLRYPRLVEACELIPCEMDTRGPEFEQTGFLRDETGQLRVTGIYVCFDDDILALMTALTLRAHTWGQDIPIIVRTTSGSGLATLFRSDAPGGNSEGIYPFPLLELSCTPELVLHGTHETVARALHQRYMQQQLEQGQTRASNPSLVPWDELPAELQESNRAQADAIAMMLKSVGYTLAPLMDWDSYRFRLPEDVIEKMARQEHQRFVTERLRAGWSLGPKDVVRKTNPNLVPWDELSPDAQERTRHPLRELPCVLAEAGLQIYRNETDPSNRGGAA